MNNIVNSIILMIKGNNQYADIELKKIEYGLYCLIDEFTKFIMFAILFCSLSLFSQFLIIIVFLCPIRIFAGGFHNKTYWGCFFFSLCQLLMIFAIDKVCDITLSIKIILLVASCILIFVLSPVDNINKPIISQNRRNKMKYISIALTIILSLVIFIIPSQYNDIATLSIVNASVLLMLGVIQNRKESKNAQSE